MRLENNINEFSIYSHETLHRALCKINENKARIVFVISENGLLEGALTDGDVRRWITKSEEIDTQTPVREITNRKCIKFVKGTDETEIEAHFSGKVSHIPLTDEAGRLVGVATWGRSSIYFGNFEISDESPVFVIAEIGNNHNGSLDVAKTLVDAAVDANANCAKFQMRDMSQLYRSGEANNVSREDLGTQYTLDLLSKFQLSDDEMYEVFDYCRSKNILPLCTPWDISSLQKLEAQGMQGYKIASADVTNHDLLVAVAKTKKPIVCSTGMTVEDEIAEAAQLLRDNNADFIMLHCNSTYPAPFSHINLTYMSRLAEIGRCPIGYSGHERGINVAVAAVALGAKVIEKHLTLDRSWEGNDHRVSLLPHEFKDMVEGIRQIETALGSRNTRALSQGEIINRETLGKSLLASVKINAGETITEEMIMVRSPGQGLSPKMKNKLIGLEATRTLESGDFFFESDLKSHVVKARNYNFRRPFGVPVRYHDFFEISQMSNLDLVEFHLSYKDLEEEPNDLLSGASFDLGFVVHAPELFAGDHLLDLTSTDEDYWQHSKSELRRVVQTTEALSPFFNNDENPLIIINAGGFSLDKPIEFSLKNEMYDRVASAIEEFNDSNVEIIIQTMPPFPWHFGGQRYHNLFMEAEEIKSFALATNTRICLDVSHSYLACNHLRHSFKEFLEIVSPFVAHSHMVDADGIDREGLQIGEGKVDFGLVASVMNEHSPHSSFIPEIWQGHKNRGEGFWTALEKLEGHF